MLFTLLQTATACRELLQCPVQESISITARQQQSLQDTQVLRAFITLLMLQAPLNATLRRLDSLVGQLQAALPPATLLVVHTGQVCTASIVHAGLPTSAVRMPSIPST